MRYFLILLAVLPGLTLALVSGCSDGPTEPCFRVAEPRGRVICDSGQVIVQPPQ